MSAATGTDRVVVQATMWQSTYLGNFMEAQLALANVVRERLGMGTHLVLGTGAAGRPWLGQLDAAGVGWSIQPRGTGPIARHLVAVGHRKRAAILHSHFTGADIAAAVAGRVLRVPCVWHLHTGFLGYPAGQRVKDLVRMRLLARAGVARAVAVAPWIADLTIRRGVPARRVAMIPNGIVLERFLALPARAQARDALGLSEGDRVVLGLAWWPEAKGADRMLDALAALAREDPGVIGLLVGTEALRTLVAQRGLTDAPWLRVSDFVSDAAQLYAAADVFLSASRHEGQSYAVGEALACGVPVVMTDIPGVAAYRDAPGVTLVAPEDPVDGLVSGVRAALTDPGAQAAAAREWARSNIGVDRWCDEVCALYAALL